MNNNQWEDTLDELCDSPEELERLKETASLFARLPEVHCSPSFHDELRQKLLHCAAKAGKEQQRRHRLTSIFNGMRSKPWFCSRSLGVAAAVLIIVFAGNFFINLPHPDEPGAVGPEKLPESPLIGDAGDYLPESSGIFSTDPAPETTPEESDREIETGVEQEPASIISEDTPPSPVNVPEQGGVEPAEPAQQEQEDGVEEEVIPSLPDEPDFEVYKNRRTFTLAGNVLLNYGPTANEQYPVEQVRYNWEPNKFGLAADNGFSFGTTEWAGQILANEGFRIREGEELRVELQETTQGLFAEVIYQTSPALVLLVHEEKGILGYYYEEKGNVAPQGCYTLLSPSKALEQQLQLRSSTEGQQLHFFFRESRLTYHEFLLEKDGSFKKVCLPAYCFSGGEMLQGIETVSFYVPAVKR